MNTKMRVPSTSGSVEHRSPLLAAAIAALLAAPGLAAAAGDAATPGADVAKGVTLEEVTVTSRRAEEDLQTTPISVVAIDGVELASLGLDSMRSFDMFVPNLSIGGTMAQGTAVANFAIRGIGGASSGWVTQESAVGVYIDDVLFAHPNGGLLDLLDVERLEVLRGPQGTLFGRNTAGGAVRYMTKKPSQELEGNVKAVVGNFDRRDVSGTLNVPLGDTVAFRASFASKQKDGYVKRLIDGEYAGDEAVTAFRGQLRFAPNDRLEMNLSADSVKSDQKYGTATTVSGYNASDLYPSTLYNPYPSATALAVRALTPSSVTTFPFVAAVRPANVTAAQATAIAAAAAQVDFNRWSAPGKYEVYGGPVPGSNTYDGKGVSLIVDVKLTDTINFKSLSGWRDVTQFIFNDGDRLPVVMYEDAQDLDITYWSQEFQLNGNSFGGKLNWVGGLFYFNDDAKEDRLRTSPTDGARAPQAKYIKTESYAVFGQGAFNFTDRFSATLGLRWNKDTKELQTFRLGRAGNAFVGAKDDWSNVSPRVGFEQKWTPDVMTYVSWAKGFKAGGHNDVVLNSATIPNFGIYGYDPENLSTYEVGVRSELWDHRVRANATVFYTKYDAMQVNAIQILNGTPVQEILNADATVKGFEFDAIAALTDNLTVKAAYGYTDAKYANSILAQTGGVIGPDSPFLRSPKNSYSLGAKYAQPTASGGELTFDLNYGWKSSQSGTSTPTNTVELPSYGILNGRFEYKSAGNWAVALYGNNLLDKYYLASAFDPAGPATKFSFGSTRAHDAVFGYAMYDVGRPREYGVEFSYKF